jgi:hypothetical protein
MDDGARCSTAANVSRISMSKLHGSGGKAAASNRPALERRNWKGGVIHAGGLGWMNGADAGANKKQLQ